MDKFNTQRRELMRRNSTLAEFLQKEQERKVQEEIQREEQINNPATRGLPTIEDKRSGRDGGKR